MDFIFNSRQKKVEIFYESKREQDALINFLNNWVTYNQGSESPTHINAPDISWSIANNPYTITCSSGAISTIDCSTTKATISSSIEENISNSTKENLSISK